MTDKFKNNFCISLSSIPPRFSSVKEVIISLNKQTIKPKQIFLNIPFVYKRFPTIKEVRIDTFKDIVADNFKIIRCEDYGPGTKLLGSINLLKNFDYVILVDDDHCYHSRMCEIFNKYFNLDNEQAYSFFTVKIYDLVMGQGADGFLINSSHLGGVLDFYNKYVKNYKHCFLNDDFWISIFLKKFKNKQVYSLEDIVMKEIGEKYIYEKINYDQPLHKIYNSILTRRYYAKYYYFKIILQKKLSQLLEFKK
jgi:predicted RNA methylase